MPQYEVFSELWYIKLEGVDARRGVKRFEDNPYSEAEKRKAWALGWEVEDIATSKFDHGARI